MKKKFEKKIYIDLKKQFEKKIEKKNWKKIWKKNFEKKFFVGNFWLKKFFGKCFT